MPDILTRPAAGKEAYLELQLSHVVHDKDLQRRSARSVVHAHQTTREPTWPTSSVASRS